MSAGFVPETGFAQGASGADNVYDTSPTGLGLSPSYLAPGAIASASASLTDSVITGAVTIAGGVNQGTGFSSVRSGTGVYTVTFTSAFAISPVVIVTPSGIENIVPILSGLNPTDFTVILTDGATGAHTNSGFNFLVTATQ